MWSLKRTKQCSKCPWRMDVNPHDIPNGYSVEKHCALESTIAKGVDFFNPKGVVRAMACHETQDSHCIGWLINQLGPGNNLTMRFKMMNCTNGQDIETVGNQHAEFKKTIPHAST